MLLLKQVVKTLLLSINQHYIILCMTDFAGQMTYRNGFSNIWKVCFNAFSPWQDACVDLKISWGMEDGLYSLPSSAYT